MFIRLVSLASVALAISAFASFSPPSSSTDAAPSFVQSRVRVIHASPDAPAVDVYVDGARVLSGVPFKAASGYLELRPGRHTFEVYAAGADPQASAPVIDASAVLRPGKDYTIAAVGTLAEIRAAVYVDNNAAPASGNAHVKVIHASPDAPAVDIAVAGGPVLVPGLSFPDAAGPLPVPAGTYDLEIRLAGTSTVVLPLPGVSLEAGTIYTVVAVGLVAGSPPLDVVTLAEEPRTATVPAGRR